jgi:hypothetical protein
MRFGREVRGGAVTGDFSLWVGGWLTSIFTGRYNQRRKGVYKPPVDRGGHLGFDAGCRFVSEEEEVQILPGV